MQRVQLARHERRPYALDFIERIFTDFQEVHGDRKCLDDAAIVAGMAKLDGRPVAIIAHQKGRHVKERQERNFGMPKPDGYRKALRVMKLAEKFNRPIFTLIDTPGAFPGLDAEERGQGEAIALNLREMSKLKVPVIVTITGEGGSGGALAIGVGDRVNILENAVYSVITPEGCAAILWKDAGQSAHAAAGMKMTAPDLAEAGIVDEIIQEPAGGAHEDWDAAASFLAVSLRQSLSEVEELSVAERNALRYKKFRYMGQFLEI
ncbi:MAG: acetyl-CoA carboxylase carboxyl transferase subunit alpha [Acidobacteria bacterium]|nr:acetyl-CoA carboxylase carboxyl transferase subunit alpha [Acidobacteriota bacterium]MBI3422882.1 acetyl-CoA carboxylase carboxyl transferase subunit alpha [Acidobacteriota bacterium]